MCIAKDLEFNNLLRGRNFLNLKIPSYTKEDIANVSKMSCNIICKWRMEQELQDYCRKYPKDTTLWIPEEHISMLMNFSKEHGICEDA